MNFQHPDNSPKLQVTTHIQILIFRLGSIIISNLHFNIIFNEDFDNSKEIVTIWDQSIAKRCYQENS